MPKAAKGTRLTEELQEEDDKEEDASEESPDYLYFTRLRLIGDWYSDVSDHVEFPEPEDININMMPFILSTDFHESKLPEYLESYWPLIECCSGPEQYKAGNDKTIDFSNNF